MNVACNIAGSIVALITPFDEQGAVDFNALTRLIEFHVENGTHGIVSVGTTGESATLTVEEHLKTIEHTIKTVKGRLPVIAGTGANSTQEAIDLTREAQRLGADAALLVVPYYNKPTQEGLYLHYKSIAEAVSIPQILYNVPGRTLLDMHNDVAVRLADIENIVGIKDATGDLERGLDLIERTKGKMVVFSGDDATALDFIKLGAKGDISVTANVAPALMSQMCEAALNGEVGLAESLNEKLVPLHNALFLESNPIPVKYAMSNLGYTANKLRLPLTQLSNQYCAAVDEAIQISRNA